MRERERLEDFRGGHVACRGCKRLIFFAPEGMGPVICCGLAYVPTRHQIDLIIYDRIQPGDLEVTAIVLPAPEPLQIQSTEDARAFLDGNEPPGLVEEETDEVDISDAEIASMAATAEEIAARRPEREATLARRGPGRPAGSAGRHGPQYD